MKKILQTKRFYAGIDYSMTSPAITVGTSSNFDDCHSFFLTKKKKLIGNHQNGIYGMEYPDYNTSDERYSLISDWALAILSKFNVSEVCLEGYSFNSKSSSATAIAENTGLLKHKLWKNNIHVLIIPPTTVKLFFAGKGNAKKEDMHDVFVKTQSIDISKILCVNKKDSPVSDVVDSFAILQYLMSTL